MGRLSCQKLQQKDQCESSGEAWRRILWLRLDQKKKKRKLELDPDSARIPTYQLSQLSNMASPDVVCQPCGSALGAPTKECSTAHKTLFLPQEWQSGRAHG